MLSTILVVGGTACHPHFIPRLRDSLHHLLTPAPNDTPPPVPIGDASMRANETKLHRIKQHHPFTSLAPLRSKLAIMNDPSPLANLAIAGIAPRWSPHLVPWVGASLAGALRTGGPEMQREEWHALQAEAARKGEQWRDDLDVAEAEVAALLGANIDELRPGEALGTVGRKRGWRDSAELPDWSRGTISAGV